MYLINLTKRPGLSGLFVFYSITFDQTSKRLSMKKTDLEQLVKDLIEMNKYLIKENEELKKEVKKGREIFLETIDKWNQSVDRLTKKVGV